MLSTNKGLSTVNGSRPMKFKHIRIDWQKVAEFSISLATLAVAVFTLVIAYRGLREANVQLHDSAKGTSEELTESFNRDVSSPVNTGIISAIDSQKPILQEHGGQFTDYQLEDYLAVYEAMDGAYLSGQIDRSDFCDLFSYYLDETAQDKEIQGYISGINNGGQNFYGGFIDLETHSKKQC